MSAQRSYDIKATPVEDNKKRKSDTGEDEWRVADCSVGYLSGDVTLGKSLSVHVGLTNLSDLRLTLRFATAQRIKIRVLDSNGNVVVESPDSGTPLPGTETLAPTEGKSWVESLTLDPKKFTPGEEYLIIGRLVALNFEASASMLLPIPAA